ncbi:sigma-70 family RNA polymerase sigma factor [Amycolatopsis sp. NPDC051106]|uniref:sigma-70 family RNA polymerase sigma factor n=1 Tax=unclassified Amycolatopsis TaxID=2618356 RepID=UPI00343D9293
MTVDETLLRSAMAGDPTATDTLLGLVRPAVLTYCRARLGGRNVRDSDAEDCAREVLLGVLRALPHYRYDADRFLGFVYGITAHKVVDARRRRTRDASSPVAHLAATQLSPSEDPEGRERVACLLGHLAAQQRNIVVLRVLLGLSARDTATTLGMPSAGAVRVSQHRALSSLRRHV